MARTPRLWSLSLTLLLISACGGGQTSSGRETTTVGDGSHDAQRGEGHVAGEVEAPRVDARPLGLSATYGDLVSAAQRLDDAGQGDATSGCVLRGDGPYRLEADVAVAMRPLPEAPPDLDARMATVTAVRVFTRWGQLGSDGQLAVAAFTTTTPPRAQNGLAIVVTDQGAYLRPAGSGSLAPVGPVPIADAATALMNGERSLGIIVVVAEAGVPLSTVHALLASLPADGTVALGVTLAPDVRLPDASARVDDGRGACPDGLPALVGTEGALDTAAILGALGPLREGAERCLASAQGAAATGGRISIAFRIGPDGHVTETCAPFDDVGDPDLRSCVLDSARATVFPPPRGPGSVDALLPLVLSPDTSFVQRPLCEPPPR